MLQVVESHACYILVFKLLNFCIFALLSLYWQFLVASGATSKNSFWCGQSDWYILICLCLIYNALWLGEVTFAKYLQTFIILPDLKVQSQSSNVNWPLHPVFPSPLYFITLSSPHWWESQLVMPPFLYSQDVLLKYLLTKQPAVTVFCFLN